MYFLGKIQGGSGCYTNEATGASGIGRFTIPPNTKRIYLSPSISGLQFELGAATGFTTTATRGAPLGSPGSLFGPFALINSQGGRPVVAIYNAAGGIVTCGVWSAP